VKGGSVGLRYKPPKHKYFCVCGRLVTLAYDRPPPTVVVHIGSHTPPFEQTSLIDGPFFSYSSFSSPLSLSVLPLWLIFSLLSIYPSPRAPHSTRVTNCLFCPLACVSATRVTFRCTLLEGKEWPFDLKMYKK